MMRGVPMYDELIMKTSPSPSALPDTPKVRRRRKPPRKNGIVLAAAERAFTEYGYAGISVDAIAEKAGVSKRTVYSNFATKQALYSEVVKKRCSEVVPPAIDQAKMDANPGKTLLEVSVAFLEALYQPSQIAFLQTVIADSRQFPDAGKLMFDGPILRTQQIFDDYFRKQSQRGLMQFPNIELAGAQFVSLLKINMHMSLMLNQPTSISHRKLEEVARASIELFLHGALKSDSPRRAAPKK
jgi:TetR/AcrR family transcriptional regulator, mexJK operon transcriptional repressor